MSKLFAIVDATFKDNLDQLTLHRMPGALPFSGKFRLIDFTLSNLRNSGVTNVAIFPYGNYRSMQDHIGSGKRWDLDRRRDGLFILPPKNLYILPGNMITFQRMSEHIEFIKRSTQDYAVITASNIVWNIDFIEVLEAHQKENADITEVMHENIRLKTFIISKKLLLEYIDSYDTQEFKTMLDVVEKGHNLKIHIYKHNAYTRTITDTYNYLKSNLDMLRFEVGRTIFKETAPIYSKEKTAPPAKYLEYSNIENSMVSSGSIINGTVINSVLGRDVVVKKGALILNSYVMSNSIIEENSIVEYAILDKQTVIKSDCVVGGSRMHPFVTQKEQVVTSLERLRVLMVASESYPFVKTGGLADVVGSLSRNLVRNGADVTVIIPFYKKIKDTFTETIRRESTKTVTYDDKKYKVTIFSYRYKKVNYYFVDSFDFFDTELVYGYDNDVERFAFFNKVVVDMLADFERFDLVHIHDWHTSLLPILLDNSIHKGTKTLLTLHNVNYQGIAKNEVIKKLGIKNFIFREELINCLDIGINTATKLSTVSPTYKEELKYEFYGKNLTHSLLRRDRDFHGILNGISSSLNPATDKSIYKNYAPKQLEDKIENKVFLQEQMQLPINTDTLVIGLVSRIVEHKGFDLILSVLEQFIQGKDVQFVLLGTGHVKYQNELLRLEAKYPKQLKMNIGYDSAVPNHIYAGADLFLMPSKIEPCGLGQMIALKYGTLPLVRNTGGLADTVERYDALTKKGNGFVFDNYDSNDLLATLEGAYEVYLHSRDDWKKMMKRAMNADHSINSVSRRYIEFYRAIIEN